MFGGFMPMSRSLAIILFLPLSVLPALFGQDTQPVPDAGRIQLKLNTDEADAVLEILEKHAAGAAVADADWERLFATEPYIRLKKREAGMNRDFTDDDFKKFVLSADLAGKAAALRHTLDAWWRADLVASAERVLAYLPDQAYIRAKVFPVIKPKTNSFVFETTTDPRFFFILIPKNREQSSRTQSRTNCTTSVIPASSRLPMKSRKIFRRT